MATVEDVTGQEGHALIRTRWAICGYYDDATPDIRARLVACEVAHDKSDTFFASTPPLEALNMLLSKYCSRRWDKYAKGLGIRFVDVKGCVSKRLLQDGLT